MDGFDRQGIRGERAGLVGTQDVDAAGFLDGSKAGGQRGLRRKRTRADGAGEREHGRKRHGDRCENRHQKQGRKRAVGQVQHGPVADQADCCGPVEQGQVAHDPQDRLLLRSLHRGRPDQFGGPAELGLRTHRNNLPQGFATPHQRAA